MILLQLFDPCKSVLSVLSVVMFGVFGQSTQLFRNKIERHRHNGIDRQKLRAFKPVGLAIG